MRIVRSEAGYSEIRSPVLTLGNFDGLHLGHAEILNKVVERAGELSAPSAVFTFDPHPRKVVTPEKSPPLITDLREKIRVIESFGVDFLILAEFTKEFASTHPREFVSDVLVGSLGVKEVWVGHDYSFGRGRAGTVEYLGELGKEFGFAVNVIPAIEIDGAVVSSSRIRLLVNEGRVEEASRLLGRDFSLRGRVVRGRDVGKTLGYPTANLEVTGELVPGNGVYAARARVDGESADAVVNIGVAPTFGKNERTVEVHLLDYKGDLYGREVTVGFVKKLRDEKKFSSPDELAERIRQDVEKAARFLKDFPPGGAD